VRELEQLAQAFPYCQTAHLLLAKAAHDQGTMLAGQRLRRAATYAADRALLRRLIEQAAPVVAEPEIIEAEEVPEAIVPVEIVAIAAAVEPALQPEPVVLVAAPVIVEAVAAPAVPVAPVALPVVIESVVAEPIVEAVAVVETAPTPVPAAVIAPVAPEIITLEPTVIEATELIPPIVVPPALPLPDPEPELLVEPTEVVVALPEVVPAAVIEKMPEPVVEEELPAQAPAIRPPVEVGEARFEFGLNEAPLPVVVPTYELPGLVDEWAAAASTLAMASPELKLTAPLPPAFTGPDLSLTPAAFTGDPELGYAYGESSRLGFSMQLLNQLFPADADELSAVETEVPATPLPPTKAFFEPDALLLEYWAEHRPAVPILPSSIDLINNFLRRQPRLTRPAMLPPAAGTQADLSVRSTHPVPDLASESLALIFARQGKTARAIEIYEQLMVKQPEKMAYFAAQIQQLQPPA
jgi:hypothetical protein